jgi:hypothetical protein
MTISRIAWLRRFQGGGGLFSTVAGVPNSPYPYIGLSATADSAGNPHFTVGACQSLEGNSYVPVLEIDFAAGVVKVLGQTLSVP